MARWGQGSVFRRGQTWWIQYYRHGRQIGESAHSDSEREARRLLRTRLKEAAGDNFVGPGAQRVNFAEMARSLREDYQVKGNRSTHLAELAIRRLRETFGDDRAIDISAERIKRYSTQRLERGLSASSVNYDLAILRRMFNVMKDSGVLAATPKITLLPAAEPRQGFLEPRAFADLHAALPDYLKDPMRFLYLSGWRVAEVRKLEWRDVDLDSRTVSLRAENSKTKQGRRLKLGQGELFEMVARAHQQRRPDCRFVFHLDGQPLGDFRKSWRRACQTAGLGKVLVHDMRRSSIRNMVRAGIPEAVAMQVSGHKTRTIFERYNIVAEADLEAAADRVDRYVAERQNEAAKVIPLGGKKAS